MNGGSSHASDHGKPACCLDTAAVACRFCHDGCVLQGLYLHILSVDAIGDPFVVDQLKTHFQRLRPSDILNTYSFPSGHTTAAVFIMGNTLANLSHCSPLHHLLYLCAGQAFVCRSKHLLVHMHVVQAVMLSTAKHLVAQLLRNMHQWQADILGPLHLLSSVQSAGMLNSS